MRKAVLIFGFIAFLCLIGLVVADVIPTQSSSEQDKLNPIMRAYVNYEYDSTVSSLNNSDQPVPAAISVDPSTFNIPVNSTGSIVAHTNDPNADLSVYSSGNGITIHDNSNYKYLFDVQIRYDDIAQYVQNGTVRMLHINDTNAVDAEWDQSVENVNGYAYFKSLPFTSLTITNYGVFSAYLPDFDHNYVNVVNLATYTGTAVINVGTQPEGVAVNHAGTRAYVANTADSTLSVINTATNTVIHTTTLFSGGGSPGGVAVSKDDSKVYVTDYSGNTVAVMSASTYAITKTITVGDNPQDLKLNHAGTKIYVTNLGDATVSVINTAADTATTPIGSGLWGNAVWTQYTALSPDDSILYVSIYNPTPGGACYVYKVNANTGANISRVTISDANAMALTADGAKLYVTQLGDNYIDIVTTSTMALSKKMSSVPVSGTSNIWIEPNGGTNTRAFFTGYATGSLGSIWTANDTYTGHNVTKSSNGNSLGTALAYGTPEKDTLSPTASFTASGRSGTTPYTVTFTDTSSGSPTAWAWNFGDGSTSTSQNPSHTYTSDGLWGVQLNASNTGGYSVDTESGYITTSTPVYVPVAAFSASPTSGAIPLTVTFTDQTTNTPTNEQWNYGDGIGVSGLPGSNTHTYTNAGTYTVWMTATNSAGSNTVTKTNLIVTASPPIPASFSTNIRTGGAPLTVQFTDTSPGVPTTWTWNFGDSGTSTAQNPSHVYNSAGTYTVTHTASNVAGWGTITASNYITVYAVPVSSFHASPLTGTYPLAVQFTDDTSNTPTSWSWNFGDGQTSTTQSPSHSYASAGTYTVSLTATNPAGSNVCTKTSYVTVSSPVVTPTASFTGSPTSGDSPLTVQFTDSSSNGPTSWSWNFGDGSAVSILENPSHQYTSGGTFTVAMTATNSAGSNTMTRTGYITVATPAAQFTATPTTGVSPLTVQFTDGTTHSPTAWQWNFGDGTANGTTKNPSHVYSSAGTYTVILTASNAAGSSTLSKAGYIGVNTPVVIPVAGFTGSPTSSDSPLTVQFTDSSSNGPTSWAWNFGDGTANSTTENPSHQYTSVGTFTVTMTATNSAGSSALVRIGYINIAMPSASFSATPLSGVAPLTVQFTDASTGAPTSFAWDFGDGTSNSTTQSPSHQYTNAGTYDVTLTASNVAGSSSLKKSGYVTVSSAVVTPVSNFTGSPTSGAVPLTVQFSDISTNGPTSWSWNFGDGNTSLAENPSHMYSSVGTYTVAMTATNSAGSNTKTRNFYVAVAATPVANFSTNVTNGATPLGVQFTDTSTGVPTSWSWNFGDSNTSTDQNPVHVYSTPGMYTVSLTATNLGGSNAITLVNRIVVASLPTASFTSNATTGVPPITIQFNDTSSFGGDNKISYGDIETAIPTGTVGSQISYVQSSSYAHSGSYSLALTGTGSSNDWAAVGNGNIPFIANTQYYWETWVYCPTTTYITPGMMQDNTPASWQSVSGSYGAINGVYGLQVLPAGVWTKISGYGTTPSNSYATGHLIFTPAQLSNGNYDTAKTLYFDDIKIYPATWAWNFGDGNTSNLSNPTHTYSVLGQYNVSLTVNNSVGSNTITKTNYINAAATTITPVVSNVVGWDFESWTAGATNQAPDGWTKGSSTGMARSADAKVGTYSYMLSGDGSLPYTGLCQQHLTGLVPGYYTLSCWMKSNGVGNGTVVCDIVNQTSWSGVFPFCEIYNGTGDNQWHYRTSRVYISDVGSGMCLRMYTDSYPSTDFRGYVDGITLTPDLPQVMVNESVTSSHIYQNFSYIPADIYGNSTLVTKFNTYNLSDASSYNVTNCIASIDGNAVTTEVDSNSRIYVNTSSLSTTTHSMSVDVQYTTPVPSTNFTVNATVGGTPFSSQFADTSTNHPTSWQWSFGDSTSNDTSQNPLHNYASAGTYDVTLTTINSGGSSTVSKVGYIQVVDLPVVNFTADSTLGPQPMTVSFSDNSTNSPTSWHWTFGDGGVNNTQNPVYTYTNAGTYAVTLTATNVGGSVSLSKSGYIHVLSTAVNTQTYAYIPNFGNGTVSVVDIPHFRVIKTIAVGTQPYGVAVSPDGTRAYVTNYNNGAASTVSVIDTTPNTVGTTINVGNGAQSIVITPDNRKVYVANNASNTVTVINGTTNTIMTTIAGFSGPSSMAMSPSGDRVYVTNGGVAGTVSVINTATDTVIATVPSVTLGGGTPMLRGITVSPSGSEYYVSSYGNNKLYAIWAVNNSLDGSISISGANQVSMNADGRIIYVTSGGSVAECNNSTGSVIRTIPMGSESSAEGVMADPFGIYTYVVGKSTNTMYYLYSANGTFVGANTTGFATPYAHGTFTRPIAAIATPITQFSANKTFGDTALTVQFTDTSLNAPTQWYWDFGDGGISAERNPVHTYTTVGAFTVSLTATNSAGSCASNKSYYIVTSQPITPVAHFTGDPTYGGVPLTVQFTDTSTNNPIAWYWEFGDGNTSREQSPIHTYTSAAAFTVRLTSSNDAGSNQYQVSPYITAESHAPQADFTADITYGTAPLSVNFTDLSTNAPTEWLWKFGDGGISTQQNTTHVYTKAGVYTVMHWANNTNGAGKRTKDYYIVVSSLTAPTYAYVPNYGAGTVSVVNLIGGDTIQTIPVGTNPIGVSVNSVGTEAYITNFNNSGDGTVSVINTTTNEVTNTINVGDGAYGIAITPDCAKAYIANSVSNTVSVIDATSHSVISTISGFNQPIGIAINPAGTRAYVANSAGTVSIINTGTDTIVGNIASDVFGGGSPMLRDITVSLDGQILYVASNGNNNVYAVWTQNNTRIYSVPAANANCMALTPDGESMYATSYQGTTLRAINLSTGSPAATIPLGVASDTEGVTADPNGHYVYVLGAASDTMYWVCTDNNTVVKTLNTFNAPYAFGNIMRQTNTPPVAPNANFTADKTYAWIGYPIQFTDLSAGLPDTWYWDFGDGNTSEVENPVHEFGMNASYTVSLIATNSHGSDNITKDYYITINDASAPGANFTATPTYGATPLTVQFTDTSEGNPRAWQWSFGDGGGSNERNPKHTYTTADAFTVSLTTENAAGDSTVTNEYYITTVAPTGAPMATFTANPTYGPFPLTVEFLDQSLGSPTSWLWDFGDGSTSTFMSPEHMYNATGSYTVTLRVSNAGGSDIAEQDYYITVTPSGGLPPTAGFVADVVTGIVPLNVQFTDQSTGNISTWNWDFGDGSTSTDQNPAHTYNVAGEYTVNLTVSNGDSLSNATSKGSYIYASATGGRPAPLPTNPAPVAGFTSNVTSGHTPFSVQFSDLTANSPTNWTWVFGDGSTSTDQNPIHMYSTAGRYDVTLVSVSPYGSNTVTKPGYIYSTNAYDTNTTGTTAPVASFIKNSVNAGSSTVGGGGTTVVFNDTSTNDPTSWSWDFGDGTSSTEQNPIHTYEKAGDYAVTLTASNTYGSSTYTFNTSETPENYSQYVTKLFTRNMSGFDFLSHTVDFYTSFMPSWLFWCILLLIPFISMYNRQGGIILVGVLYLVTGGILSQVMPTVLGGAAFWFFVLGFAGILYKLFVPD